MQWVQLKIRTFYLDMRKHFLHFFFFFFSEDDKKLKRVSQKGGVSSCGDIENRTGHGYGQLAVGKSL